MTLVDRLMALVVVVVGFGSMPLAYRWWYRDRSRDYDR